MVDAEIETHPIQFGKSSKHPSLTARVPKLVSMKAYEVYCHIYGPQEAMVTGECRGGFSVGELLAFLYAHSFPRDEWRERTEEAFRGMTQR